MSTRHQLAWAAVAATSLGLASSALAWEPIDPSQPTWSGPAPFALSGPGSADLDTATSTTELRRGMEDWSRVACTTFRTQWNGQVSTPVANGDRQSIISWVESGWPYDSSAIGVTSPLWSTRIIEADMQMNGVNFVWTTGAGAGRQVNTYSIALHESGHYLGLGHSNLSSATMYFAYSGGVDMLGQDDQNGVCSLYPGGTGTTDCTTTGCPSGQTCQSGSCVAASGDGALCSPCTRSTQCTTGVCLQYPDGNGYCGTDCTSQSQCPSDAACAFISGVGGQCIRVMGEDPTCATTATPTGCRSDSDCDASERCNTASGDCEARPSTGAALGGACTAGADCASGVCNQGICTQSCNWLDTTSCPSGFYCNGRATGSCGNGLCLAGSAGGGDFGTACTENTECASLFCAEGKCSEPCVPSGVTSCPSGTVCQAGNVQTCGSCQAAGLLGDACEGSSDCASRLCASAPEIGSFCTTPCADQDPCPGGYACVEAAGTSICIPTRRGLGNACETQAECASGICAQEGDRTYCTRSCSDVEPCPASFSCAATNDPNTRVCRPRSTARSDGGCGCSIVGGPARSGTRALLVHALLAVGAVLLRRRRS